MVNRHWFRSGLGNSPIVQHYVIQDLEQAQRDLVDPVLRQCLRDHVRLMLGHKTKSAHAILGSPDDLKFRSCLTLFRAVASEASDQTSFMEAIEQFYGSAPDPFTLAILD